MFETENVAQRLIVSKRTQIIKIFLIGGFIVKNKIILMGAPASGKSTVSEKLVAKYGFVHISPGKMLRDEVSRGTEIGKAVEEIMRNGGLVPDEIVAELLEKRLEQKDCEKGFILDGCPRSVNQAQLLEATLNRLNIKVDVVINIDIPEDEIIKRISGRRECGNSECGANYNLNYNPPKEENKCDVCGSELVQRLDDREEVVRKRIETFNKTTRKAIEWYDKKGILKVFEGTDGKKLLENIEKYISRTHDLSWVEKLMKKSELKQKSPDLLMSFGR